jgi:hypothetical protein
MRRRAQSAGLCDEIGARNALKWWDFVMDGLAWC